MAWTQEPTRTPTTLDLHIEIHDLIDPPEGHPAQSAGFRITIYDQNGDEVRRLAGDLVPHITAQQRNQILGFMDDLRTQAETELLGT